MKNTRIERIVNRFKYDKSYDVVQFKNTLTSINIMAEFIRKKYPNKSTEEIKQELFSEIIDLNYNYSQIANPRGQCFQMIAARLICDEKDFIRQECDKLKDESVIKGDIIYDTNLEENKKRVIKEIVNLIKKVEENENYKKHIETLKKDSNYKKRYGQKYNISLKKIDEEIYLNSGTLAEKTEKRIKVILPELEEDLKKIYIKNLQFLGNFFEEFGLIEKYTQRHTFKMANVGLSELGFEYSTGKNDINEIGTKELFNEDVLEKLDVDTLMMLSMFYQNRFVKEISTLGEAIFIIDTLDLWEEAKKNKRIEIPENNLKVAKNKANCVDSIITEIFNSSLEKVTFTEEEILKGHKSIDFSDEFIKVLKQESKRYFEIFNDKLPESENSLTKDINSYRQILSVRENIYTLRAGAFSTLIYSLMQSKSTNNFGIIKEELVDGKRKNTTDSNYVLIGVDFEGVNMPIRFHVHKKDLIENLKAYQGNAIIQEYEGANDFTRGIDLITTNILMPMPKRHKQFINKKYNESQGENKLISHLRFLKDISSDKFPKHLKKEVKDKNGKKQLKRIKRYMNLETAEEFVLENNQLVLVKKGEEINFG